MMRVHMPGTAPTSPPRALRGLAGRALVVCTVLSLGLAALTAADTGGPHAVPQGTAHRGVELRDCRLTVAYVARPAAALRKAFPRPPDLSQTFYGPDPLLGLWAVTCKRGRLDGRRLRRVILSVVGVPVAVSDPQEPPLANFLTHALIRTDTSSRPLAVALRRAGLPVRLARKAGYRHSPAGAVPFRAALDVPGRYRLEVRASTADPTNPHRHSNRFRYRGPKGRNARLDVSIGSAFDRFCFPDSGDCHASVAAPRGSALRRLLGDSPAEARVGFDHARLDRIDLSVE
jgi:hypothetical protein